jgi:hypothetical protein
MSALKPVDFDHPVLKKASTFEQVADFLGTDIRFVEREAQRGKLQVVRFNKRAIRIMPWHLLEWLEKAATAPRNGEPANIPAMATLLRASVAAEEPVTAS